jgi:acetyl-CoA carboxylase biotin carboxylase subunit
VDTHLRTGDFISPHYDSMVCKLIAHGADRQQALDRAAAALDALTIRGVTTTASLHRRLLDSPALRSGDYDTTTLETWLAAGHGN